MKTKRKAFTLVEIILFMFIMGLLVTLGMQTLRYTQKNYRHLYYSTYMTLKKAVGGLVAESADGKVPSNLCQELADTYNVIPGSAAACTYTYNMSPSRSFSGTSPNLNNPSFVLSNGQKFYVGSAFVAVGGENYFDAPAMLIAVDINGNSKPALLDSRSYTGDKTPDVVAFAVLDNGTVLPMSPMADRENYILTDIQICSKATGCAPVKTLTDSDYVAKNVPIREAICRAGLFPAKGAASTLSVKYDTDTTYSFKKSYTVAPACNSTTTFCEIHIHNLLFGGPGMFL